MTYQVRLIEGGEGVAVSVPALPGCHSQGSTEAEVLDNIRDAIREYLEVANELAPTDAGRLRMAALPATPG